MGINLDFTFQALANPLTGDRYGLEATLVSLAKDDPSPAGKLFNKAARDHTLFELNNRLIQKVASTVKESFGQSGIRLFYNYDLRTIDDPHYDPLVELQIMRKLPLHCESIFLEISERFRNFTSEKFDAFVYRMRNEGIRLVIDDFGAGYAGLERLYQIEPFCLKFDPFLVRNLDKDLKKSSFCSRIIQLAKLMNVLCVAECVETESEFLGCKKSGFDLVQGFFIHKPQPDLKGIPSLFSHISALEQNDRRKTHEQEERDLIIREMDVVEPVKIEDSIKVVYDRFQKHPEYSFIPVLDNFDSPLGIIHEQTLKKFIYAPYGRDLLVNKSISQSLRQHLVGCPVLEISTSQELILEVFVQNEGTEGIVLTENHRYAGFLTARSLLKVISEKQVANAREINPLTKLPGNELISLRTRDFLFDIEKERFFVYFDFNDFKPFNDKYGFRQGDRAITLFADILRNKFIQPQWFIGHVGGDDFVAMASGNEEHAIEFQRQVQETLAEFNIMVFGFFHPDEVKQDFYYSIDRSGKRKKIPLLKVCAGLLHLGPGFGIDIQEEIIQSLAKLKKEAKGSPDGFASKKMKSPFLELTHY